MSCGALVGGRGCSKPSVGFLEEKVGDTWTQQQPLDPSSMEWAVDVCWNTGSSGEQTPAFSGI